MSKTKKILEEKALNRFAEIAGIKKLNEEYDYEEVEKYAIAVTPDGWDNIDKVVIHSLTDQGVDFLAKGGNPKKLNKKHVRESVSLTELVETYNDVNGTDF